VSINHDTHHYVYILMRMISFKSQPTMKVNIHNQCSNFRLKDRKYLSTGEDWQPYLGEEVDTDHMMRVGFKSPPAMFEDGIMCKLQREHVKPGNQSTHILLFIGWKSEGYKKLHAFAQLIEYDKHVHWDKYTLKEYYQRYISQISTYIGHIKDTWLIDGNIVLMTRLELDFTQRDGVLNVTISERAEDDYTRRPDKINPEV
jgi:hypothetical protein